MNRTGLILAIVALMCVALVPGCEDDITVQLPEEPDDGPPTILFLGPDIDNNEIDVIDYQYSSYTGPRFWCAAVDKDGIAVVELQVASVELVEMIVRPDSGTTCWQVHMADNDTLDFNAKLPITLSSIQVIMYSTDQGVYYTDYGYFGRPRLLGGSVAALIDEMSTEWIKTCGRDQPRFLERVALHPPAVAATQDAFVTYMKFALKGITVTVYDQTGKSTVGNYPDFAINFTTEEEQNYVP